MGIISHSAEDYRQKATFPKDTALCQKINDLLEKLFKTLTGYNSVYPEIAIFVAVLKMQNIYF